MKKRHTFLLVLLSVFFLLAGQARAAGELTCWFPPDWQAKAGSARDIAAALGEASGIVVRPRIARSYPEILDAFSGGEPNLVYVGSFVQAIIRARNLGTALVQNVNGKEFYSGIMVYPKGQDPAAILKNSPELVAFAVGASSGESSAKAATGGRAAIGVPNHGAACNAVKAGKAKAAVVKNWWWEGNRDKFLELVSYEIPEISVLGNPDNVLTASRAVPEETRKKIGEAARKRKDVFGAPEMAPFDPARLDFSLELMRKGKIDPLTYAW